MMKRVFVSYSRQNLDVVNQLIKDLKAVGVDAWHDQTLTGGQRWWDDILANIREREIFMFALSPDSLDSEACKSELGYVEKLGKTILPVVVSDGVNLNLLTHPLSEIQVTDCRAGDKDSVFALVKALMSAAQSPALPDPLPEVPAVPVSYLSTLNDRIESLAPLTQQDQVQLLWELEEELRDGRSVMEVRDLLMRLKRREDLLARISNKIDEALKSLDELKKQERERQPIQQKATLAAKHQQRPDKFCAQCGSPFETGSKFCKNCGYRVGEAPAGAMIPNTPLPDAPPQTVSGSKVRRYACEGSDVQRLISEVKGWLESEDFDVQQMNMNDKGILLQLKKRGAWRDWVGMSTSLNIVFNQADDGLVVQIGAGKWIDKAAVGTVSLFILWPLAITVGFGAWEQAKMPERVFDFISSKLVSR